MANTIREDVAACLYHDAAARWRRFVETELKSACGDIDDSGVLGPTQPVNPEELYLNGPGAGESLRFTMLHHTQGLSDFAGRA